MTKEISAEIQKFIRDSARKYADAENEEGRMKDAYYDTYYDFINGATSMYKFLSELREIDKDVKVSAYKQIEEKDKEIKRRDKMIESVFKTHFGLAYSKSAVNKYWNKFKKENNI